MIELMNYYWIMMNFLPWIHDTPKIINCELWFWDWLIMKVCEEIKSILIMKACEVINKYNMY